MARRIGVYLAAAALMSLPIAKASAENITFAVIGPHEYELPVNFKDFDAFVQYGEFNTTDRTFTSNGGLTKTTDQGLNVGFTKLVRFITFDGLPNVGFAPEAIVPEIQSSVSGKANQYGIADPIFGGATWIKPNKDSTFGFQTFIQAPIGSSNFTNNYYDNISTILYDYQAKHWDLTGDTGGIFRSDQRVPGMDRVDPGTTFFTNLRIGWKLNQPQIPIEPFFALDYEYDTHQTDLVTGLLTNGHSEDLALGAGGVITINDKYNLTIRYSRSVYGVNEVQTNSVWVKFVSILP